MAKWKVLRSKIRTQCFADIEAETSEEAIGKFFAGEGHFYDEAETEDWHYSAEQDV